MYPVESEYKYLVESEQIYSSISSVASVYTLKRGYVHSDIYKLSITVVLSNIFTLSGTENICSIYRVAKTHRMP